MSATNAEVAILQGLLARQDEQLLKLRRELALERDQNSRLRTALLTVSEELRQAQQLREVEPEVIKAHHPSVPPIIKVVVAIDSGISPNSLRQYQEISTL